ncbi:MAG TPA: DUF6049 family protein, partial [Acidimicrobiales bacterium]|nr:DUF6049 family protein [Acidimicrobiales bacterium]
VPVDAAPPPGCRAGAPVYLNDVAGVYPVMVSLQDRDTGVTLDRLVSHLVLAPATPSATPLRFALVVPVAASQPLHTNGARSAGAGDLARLASLDPLLSGAIPITLAPDPATLAAVADTTSTQARDLLAALRRDGAAVGVQSLVQTFAPAAPYDLVGAGLSGELGAQLQRGQDIIQAQLGTRPSPQTWLTIGPVDRTTADTLVALGVSRLVVPPDDVQAGFTRLTPSQPYRLNAGGTVLPALVEDANLGTDLTLTDPVLSAHELLADLAQTYFEAPNSTRGVVALAPRDWFPTRAAVDVITAGLGASPIVAASTVDGVFADVPTARSSAPVAFPGRRPALPAARIRADRAEQAALAGAVTATLPAVGSMNDLILESEADGLGAGQRASYLAGAEQVLANELGMVSVVKSSVTLTSRQATVPVSVQSLLPVPIAVRVTVSSDQLQFPGGGTSVTLPVQTLSHQNTTFNVPVITRGTGSFPLRVSIVTANGSLVVNNTRLTIRSRAFSGVGVALSAGALVFLAVWWGRELRRSRRARRPEPEAAASPATPVPAPVQ